MREFPAHKLLPQNIDSFPLFLYQRNLCKLRVKVYEAMINPSFKIPDNCGIDMRLSGNGDDEYGEFIKIDPNMIKDIQTELEELGWRTWLGYGDSVLFVFTEDKKPNIINCASFD